MIVIIVQANLHILSQSTVSQQTKWKEKKEKRKRNKVGSCFRVANGCFRFNDVWNVFFNAPYNSKKLFHYINCFNHWQHWCSPDCQVTLLFWPLLTMGSPVWCCFNSYDKEGLCIFFLGTDNWRCYSLFVLFRLQAAFNKFVLNYDLYWSSPS